MHATRSPTYDIRWRPAPAWLAVGLVLGTACGAVMGAGMSTVVMTFDGSAPDVRAALFGGSWGGFFGGAIGIITGLVMTFAVGTHLPDEQARERAFLVSFCTTGLLAFAVLGLFFAFHPIALVTAFLSALTGGALSYWLASVI